ncbi:osmotic avoidance abnormal protein 3 isoform X2 [Coccinella septempunctata]|uniref:osmotic avoidance abnormal protein 3 isoform X2 n=1 Tax=Coccinella septempunctata TaxID=41139 RepID=UPI001D072E92|nr:osmotic avoidance abnormal protein 3 isoform X2 [Coccinella septempunctata]
MAENVKVIVRCRPMNRRERESNCKCCVKCHNCMVELWDPNEGSTFPKQFTFDYAFDENSTTEIIYNDICYPLVESVLEGYNATIFVYGQTGCGKSHTMEGNRNQEPPDKGVISRAFEHIFEAIAVTTGVKYLAIISYLEIYNEQIRDLLLPTDKISANCTLSLKETPNEGVTVPGLTSHPVHDAAECEKFLSVGSKNRMIGATLMNQNSSRSHSIFTISIEQISVQNNNESIRKGKLNLVDLAGSERQAKTGATGDRLKEATKINLSLSALGNVISALVDGKAKHIPYRDSKLTRLLQDSLGGNTRTLMIACIGPSSRDYMETLSTLRYANRAKNIYNKPKVNEDPKDTILRQYQEEIERLKTLLETKTTTDGTKLADIIESNDNLQLTNTELDAKRDELIREYEEEMQKLKNLHENEKIEKENILKQIEQIKKEYERSLNVMNREMKVRKEKDLVTDEEILRRIEVLKASMIGGERAHDKELSERRKRKKRAAEQRASVIAHLLAKIDENEDREILQNQYKDISQELNLKCELLRKYKYKVKTLEKEIRDLQGEFEVERQDYLESIRKQDRKIVLLSQIAEKISATLKKDCNYSNLEAIKEQALWLEESQMYRLPELITHRTKLPTPGRLVDIQTAPARLNSFTEDEKDGRKLDAETIIEHYFPPRKRANELLNQSTKLDTAKVFNTWREFTKRNKARSSDHLNAIIVSSPNRHRGGLPKSMNGLNNLWLHGTTSKLPHDSNLKKPLQLEALPNINPPKNATVSSFELDINS